MTKLPRRLLLWSPRILGILTALYLGVFALDAVNKGIFAFLLHAAPSLLLLLVVAVSWRREWVGGAVFITLALLYGLPAWARGDWNLGIVGPMVVTGFLFLWSWRNSRKLRLEAGTLNPKA